MSMILYIMPYLFVSRQNNNILADDECNLSIDRVNILLVILTSKQTNSNR